jgi:DNA mismatch repair ATPase MutS
MKRLQRLMELADLRHSALVHLPVQVLTLWDFHVIAAVERWQRRSGRYARRWLDALATFEAVAALAGLRFDNPGWALAAIGDHGPCVLEAADLGHPLLPGDVRVNNDVTVGPPGTFLLVTGSNMSGKSTLLRAIGLNVVLAHSLEEGVSFFMAAVKRLKQVVEAAGRRPSGAPGDPCASTGETSDPATGVLLYLLDEVLQGTNTAERQIAVRSVVRHLLARPAIGAITTHDLTLAGTADLSAAAQSVHFTEQLQSSEAGAVMKFDYRLRPGLATSRNALRLMQMVGLDDSGELGD